MIYVRRGMQPELAQEVSVPLIPHDALVAHARKELGIHKLTTANPIQATLYSAVTFAVGALMPLLTMPLLMVVLCPRSRFLARVVVTSLVFLASRWIGRLRRWNTHRECLCASPNFRSVGNGYHLGRRAAYRYRKMIRLGGETLGWQRNQCPLGNAPPAADVNRGSAKWGPHFV
jgi:hypothetical protein